jgi:hypothetical protein
MPPTALTLKPPDGEWVCRGVCRRDPDRMDGTTPMQVEDAKRMCWSCPVITSCRAWVLSLPDSKDVSGVCAAMTADERVKARRRIRRSLPTGPEEPRACTLCQVVQPAGEFYRRPRYPAGRETQCRTCCQKRHRERKAAKKAAEAGVAS